jgi:hypothetical protein
MRSSVRSHNGSRRLDPGLPKLSSVECQFPVFPPIEWCFGAGKLRKKFCHYNLMVKCFYRPTI